MTNGPYNFVKWCIFTRNNFTLPSEVIHRPKDSEFHTFTYNPLTDTYYNILPLTNLLFNQSTQGQREIETLRYSV